MTKHQPADRLGEGGVAGGRLLHGPLADRSLLSGYKSGYCVEEVQLERNARQERCLVLYKIIAWRIMYLTFLGRECPELACDQVFADCEWKPVWKIVSDDPLPKEAPPLSEFIPMLAQLGGYNHRKHDDPPGPQAIWVGIRRMTDFALAWNAFGPEEEIG